MVNWKIKKFETLEDFSVVCQFVDGRITKYSFVPWLSNKAFEKLRDINYFRDCATLYNGDLYWDDVDVSSDSLYDHGVPLETYCFRGA